MTTLTAVPYPYTTQVRQNGAPNPSFEASLTGWTAAGTGAPTVTRQPGGYIGSWYARMVATVAAGTLVLAESATRATTSGLPWTISAYVRGTPGRTVQARAYWGPAGVAVLGSAVTLTGEWQRVHVTAVAPAGATSVAAGVVVAGTGVSVGTWCDVDCVLVEQTSALAPYFDGALPDPVGGDYAWSGTAHASTSIYTVRVPTIDAATVTPRFPDGSPSLVTYEAAREAVSTVYRPIGQVDPVVVIAAPVGLRAGVLEVWCPTLAAADDVVRVLTASPESLVMLTDPARPSLEMYAVVSRVHVEPTGEDRRRWLVQADYSEVGRPGAFW